MKQLNLLTVVFAILKLTETVNWSWWSVLSPTLIYIFLKIFGCILVQFYRSIK